MIEITLAPTDAHVLTGVATPQFGRASEAIDQGDFRVVLRNIAFPVAVLTTAIGGRRDGMTISSFMTVALNPPLVAVSLTKGKPASLLTLEAGCFAVNFLDESDSTTADLFAGHHSLPKFEGLQMEIGPGGIPTLSCALAVLCAEVVSFGEAGDHYLITGEVFAGNNREGLPLLRHQSRYTYPASPD